MSPITVSKSFQPGRIIMGRLDKGSDIITSLQDYCLDNGIKAAWVNALGAMAEA